MLSIAFATATYLDRPQSKIQIAKSHRKHYSFLRSSATLLFVFSVFLFVSIMYWLYFDLREQLSDHRSKIEQGECATDKQTKTFLLFSDIFCDDDDDDIDDSSAYHFYLSLQFLNVVQVFQRKSH